MPLLDGFFRRNALRLLTARPLVRNDKNSGEAARIPRYARDARFAVLAEFRMWLQGTLAALRMHVYAGSH